MSYKNWQKEAYSSAFSQVYSASVSGGSDAMTYYVSGGFKDIKGIVSNTGIKQGDLRANLTANLSKSVTMALALNGSIKQNDMMTGVIRQVVLPVHWHVQYWIQLLMKFRQTTRHYKRTWTQKLLFIAGGMTMMI